MAIEDMHVEPVLPKRVRREFDKIPARVARAVADFDKHKGPDWRSDIKRPIQMSCVCNCVLGQLYGGFVEGCMMRGWEPSGVRVVALGLSIPEIFFSDSGADYSDKYWDALNAAFENAISPEPLTRVRGDIIG